MSGLRQPYLDFLYPQFVRCSDKVFGIEVFLNPSAKKEVQITCFPLGGSAYKHVTSKCPIKSQRRNKKKQAGPSEKRVHLYRNPFSKTANICLFFYKNDGIDAKRGGFHRSLLGE
ncbi:MAG TPA: hypothetical protein PK054_01020 [Anaerohalosphaeraceae bacterium]|nr:hypothetical protein [Anaerohalosphaeraceae bacterium]HPP55145.1 hypothetical protein [Anaerohalosphaeraceae bacterium]